MLRRRGGGRASSPARWRVLADAGHLLSDVGSIGLALFAAGLASPPGGSARRTFGYQRSEVLAALVNGLLLVAVASPIAVAAIGRLSDPPGDRRRPACSRSALLGLAGNLAATVVLAGGQREDINLEGVLRHSFADALGSLGVVLAGAFVLAGGSPIVDPIVGLLIAALILASSWRLIKEPFDVLMEAAPAGLDVDGDGRRDLRGGGRALGPRPARLDRDRRLRRARRPRRRRRAAPTATSSAAGSSCSCTSASGSSTPPCRWRRRPPQACCEVENAPAPEPDRKRGCTA